MLKFSGKQPPSLQDVDSIKVPLPIDNLSIDKNGDIFAATFPKLFILEKSFSHPYDINPPCAVFKVATIPKRDEREGRDSASGNSYDVVKIMEDDGKVLPGSTVAVHDAETGRFFLGGVIAPYIAICETR